MTFATVSAAFAPPAPLSQAPLSSALRSTSSIRRASPRAARPPRAPAALRAQAGDGSVEDFPVVGGAAAAAEYAAALAADAASPDDVDLRGRPFRDDVPVLSSVTLVGRLGRDPVLKEVQARGRSVGLLTFSLAVRAEGGGDGVTWFKCEMWGERARGAAKVLRKGLRVGVRGMMGFNSWVKRDGEEVHAPVVSVRDVDVLQSRAEGEGGEAWGGRTRAESRPAKGYDGVGAAQVQEVDDGLPF